MRKRSHVHPVHHRSHRPAARREAARSASLPPLPPEASELEPEEEADTLEAEPATPADDEYVEAEPATPADDEYEGDERESEDALMLAEAEEALAEDETEPSADVEPSVSVWPNDFIEDSELPIREPGLSVDPDDLGRQWLGTATEQGNFESSLASTDASGVRIVRILTKG